MISTLLYRVRATKGFREEGEVHWCTRRRKTHDPQETVSRVSAPLPQGKSKPPESVLLTLPNASAL